jgi:hypothetical protein
MHTDRDREITRWIGGLGAAGAEHVALRFGIGRSQTYHRLHGLVAGALLREHRLLHARPTLYAATAEGLRWTGLQRLGVQRDRGVAVGTLARHVGSAACRRGADRLTSDPTSAEGGRQRRTPRRLPIGTASPGAPGTRASPWTHASRAPIVGGVRIHGWRTRVAVGCTAFLLILCSAPSASIAQHSRRPGSGSARHHKPRRPAARHKHRTGRHPTAHSQQPAAIAPTGRGSAGEAGEEADERAAELHEAEAELLEEEAERRAEAAEGP